MSRFLIPVLVLVMLPFGVMAQAEPVPELALEKDYQNCMGEDTPKTNPEHAKYCECARTKMREWDIDSYGAAATEQAKDPTNTAKVSQKIGDVAKACLAEAFK